MAGVTRPIPKWASASIKFCSGMHKKKKKWADCASQASTLETYKKFCDMLPSFPKGGFLAYVYNSSWTGGANFTEVAGGWTWAVGVSYNPGQRPWFRGNWLRATNVGKTQEKGEKFPIFNFGGYRQNLNFLWILKNTQFNYTFYFSIGYQQGYS